MEVTNDDQARAVYAQLRAYDAGGQDITDTQYREGRTALESYLAANPHLMGGTSTPQESPEAAAPSPGVWGTFKEDIRTGNPFERALYNLPSSTMQLGKDLITPFLHPIETADSLVSLGKGIYQLAIPGEHPDEATAIAVGEFLGERYGGLENIKETFANDPAGFLADLSMVMTGGAGLAAKVGGQTANIASTVGQVGRAIDPVLAGVRGAGATVGGVGTAADTLLGLTAGLPGGPRAVRNIRRGEQLTADDPTRAADRSAQLSRALRGEEDLLGVVDTIEDGLRKTQRDASSTFGKAFKELELENIPVKLDDIEAPIRAELALQDDIGAFGRGTNASPGELATYQQVFDLIADKRRIHGDTITADVLDQIKRSIDKSWKKNVPTDDGAFIARTAIRGTVRNKLSEVSPGYSDVMRPYHQFQDMTTAMRRDLSLANRGNINVNTVARKALSILRDNASTNFGLRASYIDDLERLAGIDVLPTIAGAGMSGIMPTGLPSRLAGGLIGGQAAMTMNPAALAALPLFSPRAAAGISGGLGTVQRVLPSPGVLGTARGARLAGTTTRGVGPLSEDASRPASYAMDVLLGRTGR